MDVVIDFQFERVSMSDVILFGSILAAVAAAVVGFVFYSVYGGSKASLANAQEGQTKSGKDFAISTSLVNAQRWLNGEVIQQCFPHLNAEQREILMTGFDDECWNSMFGSEEEA